MRKILCTVLAMMLLFSGCSLIRDAQTEKEPLGRELTAIPNVEVGSGSGVPQENGTVSYAVINRDEIAAALGLSAEKVREMEYVVLLVGQEMDRGAADGTVRIENVTRKENCCLHEIVRSMTTQNFTDKTVRKTVGSGSAVSHFWTMNAEAGVRVDAEAVSAALGFSVTEMMDIPGGPEVELLPGESVNVITIPVCEVYTYDVYSRPRIGGEQLVGDGQAYKVIGFCTVVYDN